MDLSLPTTERRKNRRFPINVFVLLRGHGDTWTFGETTDVGTRGSSFVCDRPMLLNTLIEYVLTLPADLTKASPPLRVRFVGTVVRCERASGEGRAFGIAVCSSEHHYLRGEEALRFDAIEQSLFPGQQPSDGTKNQPSRDRAVG
jgi:hypothetical protein